MSTTRLSRHALIVATASYSDGRLAQLRSPAADAQALAEVLGDPDKGDFDVQLSIDEAHADLTRRIAVFFRDRLPNDLLLLHLSCHGVKDETGELYLAAADTDLDLLSATGISAAWLNERIDRTRSRRTVLLLDCCFSGSFPAGMRHRGGNYMDAPRELQGRGRAIITASNAMEYAYEGDELTGEGQPSVFTEAVVEGLRTGKADLDMDHLVSIDDLYHYVYDRVRERTPNQTPSIKSDVEGVLYLARSSYRSTVEPAKLDPELVARTADRQAEIREGAVQELVRMLNATDPAVALAARELLLMMAGDTSRRVATQAHTALEDEPRVAPPGQAPSLPRPRRPLAIGAALAALAAVAVVAIIALGGGSSSSSISGTSSAAGTTTAVNAADKIPAGNLTSNPSFEQDTSGWDTFQSRLSREQAADAPDGQQIVRVTATQPTGESSIDDDPDTVQDSVAGRPYTAAAWVKATEATDGQLACLGVREFAPGDKLLADAYAGLKMSTSSYREIRVNYVAHGTSDKIDVHVFTTRPRGSAGDSFLADAISLAPRAGESSADPGC